MEFRSSERVLYFGGGLSSAIKILIVANVAVFFLEALLELEAQFNMFFGLVPKYVWSKLYIWQPFTYMFLHGGIWHLFINMLVLWMFGSEIERYWGRKEFLGFYFITGIGSGILTALFSLNSTIPVVGASGAIYGVLLAYGLMFPNRVIYLYFFIPVKVKYFVLFIGGIAFISSLTNSASAVSHLTHLSGMVIGFIYMKSNVRISQLGDSLNNFKIKRQVKKAERVRRSYDNVMHEVDIILDRINEVGYENLTEDEKQRLEEASKVISKDKRDIN